MDAAGSIFVADGYGNARIHKFTHGGELVHSWGQPGGEIGQFRLPHSLAVDSYGRLYVADRENSRIQIFDTEGTFLDQWHDVIRPTDVCLDADGYIYVSELCNRVSVFDPHGRLLARWGNESHEKTNPLFVAPHAVAVDSQGSLYVGEVALTFAKVDRGIRNIQKFVRRGRK